MQINVKNLFIPNEENNYHPASTRLFSLLLFSFIFLTANFMVFPALGLANITVSASSMSEEEIIQLTNQDRKEFGLKPLEKNQMLQQAAQAKAENMFAKQYWNHFGPNGESPWNFIKEAGYSYAFAGENLARNYKTSQDVQTAWMNSKSHRDNILNENYDDIGIAILKGTYGGIESILVVEMFGSASVISGNTPLITSPENNSYTNASSIELSGQNEENILLKIFRNSKQTGEITPDTSAFSIKLDLEQGENKLYVSQNGIESNIVKVNLDTESPRENATKVTQQNSGTMLYLTVECESDVQEVYAPDYSSIKFTKNGTTFSASIPQNSLPEEKLLVTLVDLAKNSTQISITVQNKSPEVLGAATQNSPLYPPIPSTIMQKFNIGFLIFLTVLFSIDAAVLQIHGIQRQTSSHPHLNVIVLLVIIVTSLFF